MKIEKCGYSGFNLHTFQWFLIDLCNMKCSYCIEGYGDKNYTSSCNVHKSKIFSNIFKKVLKMIDLKSTPNFDIELLGGEPTLHPNFDCIVNELTKNEKCQNIYILTNLKQSKKNFKNINPNNKICINASIHFENYNSSIEDDCLFLKERGFNVLPVIMLHDNKKYWGDIENFLLFCKKNKMEYNISFLYDTVYGYKPIYTNKFYERFNKYIKDDKRSWPFTIDGVNRNYSYREVLDNKLHELKNINCKPLRWVIDYKGSIYNACTKEPYLIRKKSNKFIKCPMECCGCDIQWSYEKYI